MIALTIALAVFVGLSLGLLGGGGSILTVPLLVYIAGMEPKSAIAVSLLVVGVTSAVAAIPHARAHRVQWRTGLIFGGVAMAGAYAGGRVAEFIPGTILLFAFALMMIATAIAMLRGRKGIDTHKAPAQLPVGRVVLDGLVVGLVTGLVGAGGGFLVVPALALLGGLPMPVAIGTSLVVIAMKSTAGLAGYLSTVSIDWTLAAGVTLAAVVGSLIGGKLVGAISPDHLRKGFAWFVLAMSAVIFVQEAPPWITDFITAHAIAFAAGGALIAASIVAYIIIRRRRTVTRQEQQPSSERTERGH